MPILKCKMCGGDLNILEGMTVCECEYCNTKQTVPTIDNEKKVKLFERANRLRMSCQFDKAANVYESIIEEFDTEAEGYWGLLLCKYGIEYVDDPATGDKIPTCHRSSFDSFIKDPDFDMVMENCDALSRNVYREQAKQIEEIRKEIIEVSGREEPYDIFICYKETAEDGQRTIDSVLAQDIYDALTDKGYRVFFSRITLEDKLGTEYEPYIFAALNSAKIMLAFGTSYDYYNAVWVKNEWSRYLKLMAKDKDKYLIPCYKNIDAYDIPEEFAKFQAQDLGKVGATQDLIRGIEKIIGIKKNSSSMSKSLANPESDALVQRGYMALEDRDYSAADVFFERALDINPSSSRAYLGKVLARNQFQTIEELKESSINLSDDKDFKRAEKFADDSFAREIIDIKEKIGRRTTLTDILTAIKAYRLKLTNACLNEKKKEAYTALIDNQIDCEIKAIELFQELAIQSIISEEKLKDYCDNIQLIKNIIEILRDDEKHTVFSLSKEEIVKDYDEHDVWRYGRDIAFSGAVEYSDSCISLLGSEDRQKEKQREKQREKEKIEAEKKEADYQSALRCLGLLDNSEQKDLIDEENRRHEEVLIGLRDKLSEATTIAGNQVYVIEKERIQLESEYNSQLTELNNLLEISKLRHSEILNRKNQELLSLGILAIKRKKELSQEIENEKKLFGKEETELKQKIKNLQEEYQRQLLGFNKKINSIHAEETRIKGEIESEKTLHSNKIKQISSGNLDYKRGVQILQALEDYKDCIELLKEYQYYVVSKGNTIYFGKYKWQVLDINDNKMLIIAEEAVCEKPYNGTKTTVTWSDCSLRTWLNNNFYNEAFSAEEKSRIITTAVNLGENSECSTNASSPTEDKIFLLSIDEIEKYFSSDESKICYYQKGPINWWLRTPGKRPNYVAYVTGGGSVYKDGYYADAEHSGIRPALWINLES